MFHNKELPKINNLCDDIRQKNLKKRRDLCNFDEYYYSVAEKYSV